MELTKVRRPPPLKFVRPADSVFRVSDFSQSALTQPRRAESREWCKEDTINISNSTFQMFVIIITQVYDIIYYTLKMYFRNKVSLK